MDPTDRVRESYDRVAGTYAEQIGGELAAKPLDRALYRLFADLVGAALDPASAVGGHSPPRVGDVGCGPGHISGHLAGLGLRPTGVDLSAQMVAVARQRHPTVTFRVGSFADLGEPEAAWAGAVAAYSIIHLGPQQRAVAFAELARVVRPGGVLLLAFHVSAPDHPVGDTHHASTWWDHEVDLDLHYLDPAVVEAELILAGWRRFARVDREPLPGVEHPSQRCYLIARRA